MGLVNNFTITGNGNNDIVLDASNASTTSTEYWFIAVGTQDGATVEVQLSPDDTNFANLIDNGAALNVSVGEAQKLNIPTDIEDPVTVRFAASGAGASTSINVYFYDGLVS